MMQLVYTIDDSEVSVNVPAETQFFRGEDVCLADKDGDITSATPWCEAGYSVISHEKSISHKRLYKAVLDMVRGAIIAEFPEKNLAGFSLEKYHEYVSNQEHVDFLDRRIKRFYGKDLPFEDSIFVDVLEEALGRSLSYTPRDEVSPHWIIVRIITPGSNAFNPAHKDIYEGYDALGLSPSMVNAWIPICGVNNRAGLALAPGSHLLKESQIIRTSAGAQMNNNRFSVNCVKEWGGCSSLITVAPPPGEMLIFSSHLIHGLGRNLNDDHTRVALEFRLHAD